MNIHVRWKIMEWCMHWINNNKFLRCNTRRYTNPHGYYFREAFSDFGLFFHIGPYYAWTVNFSNSTETKCFIFHGKFALFPIFQSKLPWQTKTVYSLIGTMSCKIYSNKHLVSCRISSKLQAFYVSSTNLK